MEFVTDNTRVEYEQFVSTHNIGSFMQSLKWAKVKSGWDEKAIISRDNDGNVSGAVLVLIRKMPLGWSLMYSPRGPICDFNNNFVLADLFSGVKQLAKQVRAFSYIIDPEVLEHDETGINNLKEQGFIHNLGGDNFETIQPRFNYRLSIKDRTLDEIFSSFHSKTRYNIRVAGKHNVEVKVCTKEYLDDFVRLMKTTGERDNFGIRTKAYFEGFLDGLGDNARLYLSFYNGEAVSGAIWVNYAGRASYVYGASDNNHRNAMPSYLMQWKMISDSVELGCYLYDFQGVSGNIEDENNPLYGLYRFKKGFNGELVGLAGEFEIVYNKPIKIAVDFALRVMAKIRDLKKNSIKK